MKNKAVFVSLAMGAAALALAGCSSFGDFGRKGTPVAAAVAAPLQPVALAEADPIPAPIPAPPAVIATANVAAPTSSPNLGVVPEAAEGKVLSPEEKFRVIAELEALARSQGVATEQARAELARCPDLAKLSVEERMKRVAEGYKC